MSTFPKDGTACDVVCKYETVAEEIRWSRSPMDGTSRLVGKVNPLSPYLTPVGWRPRVKKENTT